MKRETSVVPSPFVQLALTLFFGAVIGFLTVGFVLALSSIGQEQQRLNSNVPFHLIMALPIYLLLHLIRRNTLYFPLKVSDLATESSAAHWSRVMSPVHFIGTLLTHASGMSVGREGAVVLYSAGFVRLLRLEWRFWGPILASIGFASILGHAWLAPVFMFELFGVTTTVQKLFSLIGAIVAVLIGQHFQLPHLISPHIVIDDNIGFWSKFVILFLVGLVFGFTMRYYHMVHAKLSAFFFKSSIWVRLAVVMLLIGVLYIPEMRHYQSLGMDQFHSLAPAQATALVTGFMKLFLTVISTSVGFLGGEFVPLVYAGVHIGSGLLHALGYNPVVGAALGAFLLFGTGTKLKWVTYFLMLSVLGLGWWFWAYYVLSISLAFSGSESLYRQREAVPI